MVYQEMAIMTKPGEIRELVILSIFINVMNSQHPKIDSQTQAAYLSLARSNHNFPVTTLPCSEVFMLGTCIQLVSPNGLTWFTTKECSAL